MSRAVASWSKASCLGLALRNARWKGRRKIRRIGIEEAGVGGGVGEGARVGRGGEGVGGVRVKGSRGEVGGVEAGARARAGRGGGGRGVGVGGVEERSGRGGEGVGVGTAAVVGVSGAVGVKGVEEEGKWTVEMKIPTRHLPKKLWKITEKPQSR
ncbi:hypothetical protein ANN_18499 [Periplaneta americana]|uniref:Uncharacterized protein n=1 Tax=Periplaneta americana TaxID=6978 RepID=A0ABQ8SNX5_PERAM|nr:hypothetical protein ANN_18499 [Periplaneta americana]